ncbi:DUF4397 domain-containing protein [Flavobacterium hiemivividum]|uniref:DUF4397 domain-containing protein n=1 Tax=Flavobacterium hiemivividum TaxID=2541734 RepID=A0A4R5D1S7_9FLAO|nr:DUF4397 domain-containing protein [Flavobacterium hiemivividum]TDE05401.1 DUF4397 domain-containing protein [Flavobacterium hiemivividum]
MKNIKITITKYLGLAVLSLGIFSSCGDETNFSPYKESVSPNDALVKFQHTAIGPDGKNFSAIWYVDDVKTSGVTVLSGLPIGTNYGSGYPASINYSLIPSGTKNLRVETPATATVAASTLFTSPFNIEAKKNYTSFIVGLSPNYTAHTIKDDLSVTLTDPTKAYIRFINVITNTPTTGFDFSIKELNSNAVIYSGVTYLKGNEAFIPIIPIPDLESSTYEVQLRTVGTATIVAKTTLTPRKGRAYTFFSRGYVGGLNNGLPSATVNIPVLTFFTNK